MATITWRRLQTGDASTYAEFDRACTAVDGEVVVPWKSFEALMNTPEIFTVGGFLPDSQLVAAGYAEKSGTQATFKPKIHPDFRAQNLARPLIEALEEDAKSHATSISEYIIRSEALDEHSEHAFGEMGYQMGFIELRMRYTVGQALKVPATNITFETWTDENKTDFYATYLESFRERMTQPPADAEEWLADHTDDADFRADWSFLARLNGKPAGFVTMFHWTDNTPRAYLSQIGTVPGVRGQGMSVALMNKVLGLVEAAQIPFLDLHVNTNNPQAIRVYERAGFLTIGRRGKFSRYTDV